MAEAGAIRVTVLYSPAPREVRGVGRWRWRPAPRCLQALEASGLPALAPELDLHHAAVGVWGRQARQEQVLRDGDRVEVLRPLQVDPKVARRERFRKQGITRGRSVRRQAGGAGRGKPGSTSPRRPCSRSR